MFIMSALRFIMVVLICLPIGYLLFMLASDLADDFNKERANNRANNEKIKRNTIDGRERSVHNGRRPRWSR